MYLYMYVLCVCVCVYICVCVFNHFSFSSAPRCPQLLTTKSRVFEKQPYIHTPCLANMDMQTLCYQHAQYQSVHYQAYSNLAYYTITFLTSPPVLPARVCGLDCRKFSLQEALRVCSNIL